MRTPDGAAAFTIEDGHGYPFFLDGRAFVMHSDQNSVSRLDADGSIEWTYDFTAPVTCVDAAAGFLLAGTLAGTAELVDGEGRGVYTAEPSGSRIAGVYGCALSADGSMMALVCGLDRQRFVLMGRQGGADGSAAFTSGVFTSGVSASGVSAWRVLAHEFIGDGLRRPVIVRFVDGGGSVAFERQGGLGLYAVRARTSRFVPLDGRMLALEDCGSGTPVSGILFLLTEGAAPKDAAIEAPDAPDPSATPLSETPLSKTLAAVSLSGELLIEAPFTSEAAFLRRLDGVLLAGGGSALAAFSLESK